MKNLTNMEVTSYAGSVTSIAGALTFTDWGVVIGIITALLTCVANLVYMARRDRREERALDAQLGDGK